MRCCALVELELASMELARRVAHLMSADPDATLDEDHVAYPAEAVPSAMISQAIPGYPDVVIGTS